MCHSIMLISRRPGRKLIEKVNQNFTNTDKEFLISYESGVPIGKKCCAGDLSGYPSIQWKLKNILTLKETNPSKFNEGIGKIDAISFEDKEYKKIEIEG